jgi:hypothetical protein
MQLYPVVTSSGANRRALRPTGPVAIALAIVLLGLVVLTMSAARAHTAAKPPPLLWLVKSNDVAGLKHQAGKDGVKLRAFTWVGCGGKSDPDPCKAGQQPIYTNYWDLRAKADTGWHGIAVFDIETWPFTPAAQRADPDKWICKAAALQQKDRHLKVIITPYAQPPRKQMIPEDVAAAKCGAYAIDVQTQFANGHPREFSWFIRTAVKKIRQVNKTVIILAGLATNHPHVETAAHLVADYHAALAAGVAGFWLNANDWLDRNMCTAAQGGPGCPEIGIQFLTRVGMTDGGS